MVSQLFITGVVWGSMLVVAGSAVLAWRQRPRPGATAFAVTMLAATWWVTTSALGMFATDRAMTVFWGKVEWGAIVYLPVAWLAFALAYTGRSEHCTRRTIGGLAVLPTVTLALALTNGVFHDLVYAGDPTFHAGGSILLVERTFGPWLWVHVAYSYLLVAVGAVLVVQMVTERRPLYRGQAVGLVLVVAAPWTANVVFLAGLSPVPFFDPTPYSFVISGAAGIAALTQLEFLDAVPVTNRVARQSVVENVDAGVLVADTDGRIVDANPRATMLLGDDTGPPVGDHLAEWLPNTVTTGVSGTSANTDGSSADVDTIPTDGGTTRNDDGAVSVGDGPVPVEESTAPFGAERGPSDRTVTVVADENGGRSRYLDVSVTELTDEYGNLTGRIVLLRDVTARRNRLQRLNVLNRVLRHNLRNEMNVIYGQADRLVYGDDDPEAVADAIRSKADELTALAEKAREIDEILGEERESPTDLTRVVEIERDRVNDRYPDVDVTTATPDGRLAVDAAAGAVVRNVVENAAEHNTAADPWVEIDVSVEDETVTVVVTDNGPGIPQDELAAFDGDLETQLEHASGLGLWLAHWGVSAAGGRIDVADREPNGTRVTVTVPLLSESETADGPGDDPSVERSGADDDSATDGSVTDPTSRDRTVEDPFDDVLGEDTTGDD